MAGMKLCRIAYDPVYSRGYTGASTAAYVFLSDVVGGEVYVPAQRCNTAAFPVLSANSLSSSSTGQHCCFYTAGRYCTLGGSWE